MSVKPFFTAMKVKGRHYFYKVTYVGKGRKKYEYVGRRETIKKIMKDLKTEGLNKSGARRLAWLGRRPYEAEVRGSSPRGPTIKPLTSVLQFHIGFHISL